jgi:chlorite dismutase
MEPNRRLLVSFIGGTSGPWLVERMATVKGAGVREVDAVAIFEGSDTAHLPPDVAWVLRGITGPDHYVIEAERQVLAARQAPLGRPTATSAAMIPIRKTAGWWALPHRERRVIFEDRSHHIASTLAYLHRIARRLHHGRDLGEPFDFITWFEFAPTDSAAFDDLVGMLRATEEWTYVEREVDIRLNRANEPS